VLLARVAGDGTQVEVRDIATGAEIGTPASLAGYQLLGGRVDQPRHLGVLLAWTQPKDFDAVLTVNMATGTLGGTPIQLDSGGSVPGWIRGYQDMTVDERTGLVYLAERRQFGCLQGLPTTIIATVDPTTGGITDTRSGPGCPWQIAADNAGHLVVNWAQQPEPVLPLADAITAYDTATLTPGVTAHVGGGVAEWALAVDAPHHLAVELLNNEVPNAQGTVPDSNMTSELVVVDMNTGRQVGTIRGASTRQAQWGYGYIGVLDDETENTVQLDPATRTGWMEAATGNQLLRFSY
jgi:hypothetical protein